MSESCDTTVAVFAQHTDVSNEQEESSSLLSGGNHFFEDIVLWALESMTIVGFAFEVA